jgi:hypothetical protein
MSGKLYKAAFVAEVLDDRFGRGPVVGHCSRWLDWRCRAAMCRLPAVQLQMAVNNRFHGR